MGRMQVRAAVLGVGAFAAIAAVLLVHSAASQSLQTHPLNEITDASGAQVLFIRYLGDDSKGGSDEVKVTFDATGLDKVFVFLTVKPLDSGSGSQQAGGKPEQCVLLDLVPLVEPAYPCFFVFSPASVNSPLSGYFVIDAPGPGTHTVSFPTVSHYMSRTLAVFGVDKPGAAPAQSHPVSELVKVDTPVGSKYLRYLGSGRTPGTSETIVTIDPAGISSAVVFASVSPTDSAPDNKMQLEVDDVPTADSEFFVKKDPDGKTKKHALNSPLALATRVDLAGKSGTVKIELPASQFFENRHLFVFGVPA